MRICLFDIDGTLIQSGGAGQGALDEAMIESFSLQPPIEQVAVHGRTDRAIAADLFAAHAIELNDQNWQTFRTAYLSRLPGLLQRRKGGLLPGVQQLLSELKQHTDLRLGLLTGNTEAGAGIKLKHFGLHHFFEFGGFGDQHQNRDDVARSALAKAIEIFGENVDTESVWVIGDTPSDVRCGRAIGARVVAVATGQHTLDELGATNPDHLVADFSDPNSWRSIWGHP